MRCSSSAIPLLGALVVSGSPGCVCGGVECVLVGFYRQGTEGQPFAHSRDRKWLQYGPEHGPPLKLQGVISLPSQGHSCEISKEKWKIQMFYPEHLRPRGSGRL